MQVNKSKEDTRCVSPSVLVICAERMRLVVYRHTYNKMQEEYVKEDEVPV